jgi:hypothetical protein
MHRTLAINGWGEMVRIGLLGPLQLADETGAAVGVSGARLRILLAALALNAGTPTSGETLAAFVWDGAPPSGYATTLRSHVMRLRRTLSAARIGFWQKVSDPPIRTCRTTWCPRTSSSSRRRLPQRRSTRAAGAVPSTALRSRSRHCNPTAKRCSQRWSRSAVCRCKRSNLSASGARRPRSVRSRQDRGWTSPRRYRRTGRPTPTGPPVPARRPGPHRAFFA